MDAIRAGRAHVDPMLELAGKIAQQQSWFFCV
jgi:hypothetical protein